jgi:hypothetical protein
MQQVATYGLWPQQSTLGATTIIAAYYAYLVGNANPNAYVVPSPWIGWYAHHLFTTQDAHIAGYARAYSRADQSKSSLPESIGGLALMPSR